MRKRGQLDDAGKIISTDLGIKPGEVCPRCGGDLRVLHRWKTCARCGPICKDGYPVPKPKEPNKFLDCGIAGAGPPRKKYPS